MTETVMRTWHAKVARGDLRDWVAAYRDRVLDGMRGVDGFRAVTFLAARDGDPCDVTVLTEWDDMDAVRRFAGDDAARAVVPDFMERYFVAADATAGFHDVILQEAGQ